MAAHNPGADVETVIETPLSHLAVVTGVPSEASDCAVGPVRRRGRLASWGERGMVSAEWAVGLIAAIAIAGVLVAVVTTGGVRSAILKFILMVIDAFATHIDKV